MFICYQRMLLSTTMPLKCYSTQPFLLRAVIHHLTTSACFGCVALDGCYVLATSPNIELHMMQWSPAVVVFFFPATVHSRKKKSSMDVEIVVLFSDRRMYFWCIFCSNMFSLKMCTSRVLTTSAALTVYKTKRKAVSRMQRIREKIM